VSTFDVSQYLKNLATDLIRGFEESSRSNHPSHIGSIKEKAARKKLQALLPGYIAVGEGFVIDSYGNQSRQTDLILYERYQSSVFELGVPEATYYPCEGVCAVGEVKTALDLKELRDAYAKIESVKALKRNPGRNSYRKYGSTTAIWGGGDDTQVSPKNPHFQIYGFVLCERFATSPQTLLQNVADLNQAYSALLQPNLIVSLHDGILAPCRINQQKEYYVTWDLHETNALAHLSIKEDNFIFLVDNLVQHISTSHTTCELPIQPYLRYVDNLECTTYLLESREIDTAQ
jgi:hypothetical protein